MDEAQSVAMSQFDHWSVAGGTHLTVDRWLQDYLSRLYQEVLSEPLPRELIDIVDRFHERRCNERS